MRSIDFTPFYRSTVGFDRLFDMLEAAQTRSDWPPYNIERSGDDRYRISMAVAGFAPNEIELTQHGNTLIVAGEKKIEKGPKELLHQGIAFRNFKQTFNVADHVRVEAANLENGLLSIDLVREVPEQLKPRRIEIGRSSVSATPAQDNQPLQIDQQADRQNKAA
jgi:molecular chaperone IbpA